MKKCKTCNSEFVAKNKRKQYCSQKCKWDFENNKSLKKTLEKRKDTRTVEQMYLENLRKEKRKNKSIPRNKIS